MLHENVPDNDVPAGSLQYVWNICLSMQKPPETAW
jgi:hypothetical protein